MRFRHSTIRSLLAPALAALLALAAACGAAPEPARSALTDDFGDSLTVGESPRRIVSLNPTTTEMLFAIGAGSRLVGRTTYDVLPVAARAVADLGPGIRPNVEAVLGAHPDLVILYASNDNRAAARALRAAGVRTMAYRVDRLSDYARVTMALGRLTGDSAAARRNVESTQAALDRVRAATTTLPRPTVFWPLFDAPLLAIGGGSWLNELIVIAGGRNVYESLPQPSPAITFEDLVRRDPDVIIASERSRERYLHDPRWSTLRAVREGRVVQVDSFLATGPTDRVGASAVALAKLLHPGARF